MNLFRRQEPLLPIRALHLDLKGCPPTPDRLLSLLPLIASARYNALLVEWEDQFPWTVDERFRNETAYTPEQVKAFHETAHHLGLEVIPLVQCLGHMETPLSLPDYAHLREVPTRSDVLNALAPGATDLVEKMIDDVLALTPHPTHFHLGGDEAWTFATNPQTKAYADQHGKGALYLHHVEPLLDKLNAKNIRPILWHDMMLHWDQPALERLSQKADLMVWGYQGKVLQTKGHHNAANFEKLARAGLQLWGACAYKGADGHNADLPNYPNRQENTLGYTEVATRFKLKGIAATGWSRYSTQRTQNEPIDAALDSLVNCAVILHDGQPPEAGREAVLQFLKDQNELPRFQNCFDAMTKLTTARKTGWTAVQDLREQLALQQQDPRRHGAQADTQYLTALQRALKQADDAETATKSAFANLMPDVWTTRYLGERLQPLRDELATLTPNVK